MRDKTPRLNNEKDQDSMGYTLNALRQEMDRMEKRLQILEMIYEAFLEGFVVIDLTSHTKNSFIWKGAEREKLALFLEDGTVLRDEIFMETNEKCLHYFTGKRVGITAKMTFGDPTKVGMYEVVEIVLYEECTQP